MTRTALYAKTLFVLLSIGFALFSAIPTHAKERDGKKEMKRIAKLVNGTKWDGRCKLSASKEDSEGRDWDLDVENFFPDSSESVRLESCEKIGEVTHCVRTSEIPRKKGGKDCLIDRLIYSPATANQVVVLTTETVQMNHVKKSCLKGYFSDDGKEDATIRKGRRCEGKRTE